MGVVSSFRKFLISLLVSLFFQETFSPRFPLYIYGWVASLGRGSALKKRGKLVLGVGERETSQPLDVHKLCCTRKLLPAAARFCLGERPYQVWSPYTKSKENKKEEAWLCSHQHQPIRLEERGIEEKTTRNIAAGNSCN